MGAPTHHLTLTSISPGRVIRRGADSDIFRKRSCSDLRCTISVGRSTKRVESMKLETFIRRGASVETVIHLGNSICGFPPLPRKHCRAGVSQRQSRGCKPDWHPFQISPALISAQHHCRCDVVPGRDCFGFPTRHPNHTRLYRTGLAAAAIRSGYAWFFSPRSGWAGQGISFFRASCLIPAGGRRVGR